MKSSRTRNTHGEPIRHFLRSLVLVASFFGGAVQGAAAQAPSTSSDDEALLERATQVWKGDLDGMLKRGFVRFATAHNPLFFSEDLFEQRGLAIDIARALEDYLDKKYPKKGRHLRVVIMPMARDAILPAVIEGRADFAAANLTITAARSRQVAFTVPSVDGIREIIATGPGMPTVASFDDLAKIKVHVRKSSSYYEHLTALNKSRKAARKPAIPIEPMDEHLEDYDLLEMVNAGLIPAIVIDDHKAKIWQRVFDKVKLHRTLAIHEGGKTAWAVRTDSVKLRKSLGTFVKTIRKGSLLGNILIKRYIRDRAWIDNIRSKEAMSRYDASLALIKRYAGRYDFDWLMIAAQAYQESKLDQSKRSPAGAIGIMQVMPATAKDPVVAIPNIENAEDNVHAGVKYLRHLRESYFNDAEIPALDRVLFSFAAYNAGPGNLRRARQRAKKLGLNPNLWFDNVEIAAGKAISREPVIYVRNIFKYFVAYGLIEKVRDGRESARSNRAN